MGEDCGEGLLSIVFWCSEAAVCGAGGRGGEGECVCGERWREECACREGGRWRKMMEGGMCVWEVEGRRLQVYVEEERVSGEDVRLWECEDVKLWE